MSLNNPQPMSLFYCDTCGRSFRLKTNLIKHILIHAAQDDLPRKEGLTCFQCDMVFKNKGLLMCHNAKFHSTNKSCTPKTIVESHKCKHFCQACKSNFFYLKDLRYHIRESHFNLLSQIPYCHFKKVNQIWFEKVLNSKNIVEIKKVARNILLMRKLDDNTAMKVSEHSTEVIDLREVYPTQNMSNVQCSYCLRKYDRGYIDKHITLVHMKNNQKEVPPE